jgi:hypothetical protein
MLGPVNRAAIVDVVPLEAWSASSAPDVID